MRYLHIILGLAMLGFMAVQYNDPDGLLWVFYYGVPAAWAFVAAIRPQLLHASRTRLLLWLCAVAWLGLVIFYWPTVANFWRSEVFMAEETAREGMGLMIAWVVTLCALFSAHAGKPITAARSPTATRS
jgi:hypothetical protein